MNIMRKLIPTLVLMVGICVSVQADIPQSSKLVEKAKTAPKAATKSTTKSKAATKAMPKTAPKATPKIPKAKKIPPPPKRESGVTFDTCLGCHDEFRKQKNYLQMRDLMVKRVERGEMPPSTNLSAAERQRLIRQIQTLKG
jgi:hypothetical protein